MKTNKVKNLENELTKVLIVVHQLNSYKIALENFNQDLKTRSDKGMISKGKYGVTYMLNNLSRIKNNFYETLTDLIKSTPIIPELYSKKINYLEMRN